MNPYEVSGGLRWMNLRQVRPAAAFAIAVLALLLTAGICEAQTVTILHVFRNHGSVVYPYGPPVQGRDGELYGLTNFSTWGSIFREKTTGEGSVLYEFGSADGGGGVPFSSLLLPSFDTWYGTTGDTLDSDGGVLYQVTSKGEYSILHSFSTSIVGAAPTGSPIEADDSIYGTTVGGRDVGPSVYGYYRAAGSFNVVHQFSRSELLVSAGALVETRGDMLFGTGTGSDQCGAAFRMTTSGTSVRVFNFDCSLNVGTVTSSLVEGRDGNFYGTSRGFLANGAVFKMTHGGAVTVLHQFGSTPNDGVSPRGGLTLGSDGNLYGTTGYGGKCACGTIFEVSTSGEYRKLYDFNVAEQTPSGLVQHTDGKFYGYLEFGGRTGSENSGAFYSLDMGLAPFVTFIHVQGHAGQTVEILGQGLTGTTSVLFNGVAAPDFKVISDTFMTAVIPSGASTGPVVVATPGGTLTSNKNYVVMQ